MRRSSGHVELNFVGELRSLSNSQVASRSLIEMDRSQNDWFQPQQGNEGGLRAVRAAPDGFNRNRNLFRPAPLSAGLSLVFLILAIHVSGPEEP